MMTKETEIAHDRLQFAYFVKEMVGKYPYCVEVSALPSLKSPEFVEEEYAVRINDCMGNHDIIERRVGVLYGTMWRTTNPEDGFYLFFKEEENKERLILNYPEIVIDEDPLRLLERNRNREPKNKNCLPKVATFINVVIIIVVIFSFYFVKGF